MADLIKTIDYIRHERLRPLQQSLKAHIEISHNENLHISPSVLKDVSKRLLQIEQDLLTLLT